MLILVINCGSSSLKYQLFAMEGEKVLAKGLVERIGMDGAALIHQPQDREKIKLEEQIPDHSRAIELVLHALTQGEGRVIEDMATIKAVGHRVVHGGEKFSSSVLVDEGILQGIKECIPLAPLHNPPNVIGIEACQKLLPGTPQVVVFDTAFHQTIPEENFIYGIPYEMYTKYKIRKYGFHGTSHKYVSIKAAQMMGKPLTSLKLITCHLGNGASIVAVDQGQSIATSMGFTPLAGLIMGTRTGDLDPAIVTYIMETVGMDLDQVNQVMNKQSGVLGISGISSDFRDLELAAEQGHKRAQLALNAFVNRAKQFIGAYAAVLNGLDAVIFTAGLGENSAYIRSEICKDMDFLGLGLDLEQNKVRGEARDISLAEAKVKVLVIPTNEELMIARETAALAGA